MHPAVVENLLARPAWQPQPCAVVAMRGPDAVDLLHRLCTQDVTPLRQPQASCRGLLVSAQGKLLHDFIAWRVDDAVHLATVAGTGAALLAHLERYTIVEQVDYTVLGERVAAAWVYGGPRAAVLPWQREQALEAVAAGPSDARLTWLPAPRALSPFALVLAEPSASGPALAAELARTCLPSDDGAGWPAPLGDAAWRYLRVRAGVPAVGEDFAAGAMPLEFRLGAEAVSWRKGCYIGQEVLSRLDSYRKTARLLMGFCAPAASADALAAAGASRRLLQAGRPVGRVTSWALGRGDWPSHPAGPGPCVFGLALVKASAAVAGTDVQLELNAGPWPADVGPEGRSEVRREAAAKAVAAPHHALATLYDCRAWRPSSPT